MSRATASAIASLLEKTRRIAIRHYKTRLTEFLSKPEAQELRPFVYLSTANDKLRRDGIAAFDLPAVATCPMAGVCLTYCLAQFNNYTWDAKLRRMVENYLAAESPAFVQLFVGAVSQLPRNVHIVRLHSSGDVYSQAYLDKLVEVAQAVAKTAPDITFYLYSKSSHLDWSKWNAQPNTVAPVFSDGGRLAVDEELPHSKIFASVPELLASGYADAHESDLPAAQGKERVGLVIHGSVAIGTFRRQRAAYARAALKRAS